NLNVQTLLAATLEEVSAACINQAVRFKLSLTSPAKELTWVTDPNEIPVRQPGPTPTTVVRNNTTYYEYLYPGLKTYSESGEKSITVIAEFPDASGCSDQQQEIEVFFDVYDPPEAKFSFISGGCTNTKVTFRDESLDGGDPIRTWLWDFGDGTTSDKQHPEHIYLQPGNYQVKLSVKN